MDVNIVLSGDFEGIEKGLWDSVDAGENEVEEGGCGRVLCEDGLAGKLERTDDLQTK